MKTRNERAHVKFLSYLSSLLVQ